jgi:hypothetical protein
LAFSTFSYFFKVKGMGKSVIVYAERSFGRGKNVDAENEGLQLVMLP